MSILNVFSAQHCTTFTKKMIEDNSTMDETAQFLGVSSYLAVVLYIVNFLYQE